MEWDTLLRAIGSTEESSFKEICQGLGSDCPEDREEWSEMFRALNNAEREGLVEISRTNGKIDTAILTEGGVAWLKGK